MKISSHSTQPEYFRLATKKKARREIVNVWRKLTGLRSIPDDRQYWTLCNLQPNVPGAEIVDLVNTGALLHKSQFWGVDYDANLKVPNIIGRNREWHPDANWLKGDLLEVIDDHFDEFNPALIYYDSIRTVTPFSSRTYLANLMDMCDRSGTVIAANLMLSDGHSARRFDAHLFIEELASHIRNLKAWTLYPEYYLYVGSRTLMGTYIFYLK